MKEIFGHVDHGGIEIPYYTWEVEHPRAFLILIHGLKSHAGWFLETGAAFSEKGIKVYAFDRRGSGRSKEKRGHIESYPLWIEDLRAVIELARRENSDLSIHLLGHCFGAKIALSFAIDRPNEFRSLILIAPPLFSLKADISWMEKGKVLTSLLLGKTFAISVPVRDNMFTAVPEKNRFIEEDSLRLRSMTTRFCLETFKLDRHIKRHFRSVSSPTLVLTAKEDSVVDNFKIETRFFAPLKCGRKALEQFDCHHDLFFEPFGDLVVERIGQWVTQEC